MSFDFYATQQAILDRLATIGSSIGIADHFTVLDLTDEVAQTVGAKLRFEDFEPLDQVGRSVAHKSLWTFSVEVDAARASTSSKEVAADLFSAALASLVAWEVRPGTTIRIEPGLKPEQDDRILRLSFGFSIPAYLAG